MREIYTFALEDDGEVKLLMNNDLLKEFGVTEQNLKESINYDLINELTKNIVKILDNGTVLKDN